jgi:hypothetical protein
MSIIGMPLLLALETYGGFANTSNTRCSAAVSAVSGS